MTNKASIFDFDSEKEFWESAKEDVLLAIKEALHKFDTCRIGLSGGSTPQKLYELLSEEKIPWEKIKLIVLDERYVPSDHPESNLKMIRKALLNKIPLPPENLICFDTSLPQISAAKEMSRKLIDLTFKRFPIFDLLILGMGEDGHIASIFEDDIGFHCPYYASVARAKGYTIEDRLTVCMIALKKSSAAMLLLKGSEKAKLIPKIENSELVIFKELSSEVPIKVLAYTK